MLEKKILNAFIGKVVAINVDAFNNPLSEWERDNVEQKYLDEFEAKKAEGEEASFEKTYGCTLMAYVQTLTFWFAFHIGDGKCVMFHKTENGLSWDQPIPWDERCFLNKTTSLCDSQADDGFRYCFQGNGEFPLAVFLGSDGLDDSYGDGDFLTNFYIELYKILLRKDADKAKDDLKKFLPHISERGSKDDMSVASVFSSDNAYDTYLMLSDYQESKLIDQQNDLAYKQDSEEKRAEILRRKENPTNAEQIELRYAESDIANLEQQLQRNKKRQTALKVIEQSLRIIISNR